MTNKVMNVSPIPTVHHVIAHAEPGYVRTYIPIFAHVGSREESVIPILHLEGKADFSAYYNHLNIKSNGRNNQ